MKKTGNWLAASIRPSLVFVAAASVVVFLLWYLLGALVPAFSDAEIATRSASSTVYELAKNPLGLPHKILQFIPQYFGHHGMFAMRSASALFGLVTVMAFYCVLASWYTRRFALLGTLLFASSSWFLHTARSGTDAAMYMLLFLSVAIVVWLQKTRGGKLPLIAGAGLVVALLYMPGMIWFVVPALLWQSRRITRYMGDQPMALLILIVFGGLAVMAPLAWALFRDPNLIKAYFGLPQVFPPVLDIVKNIASVPVMLFFRGPDAPDMWLARLPILDWFSAVMLVVGAYAFILKFKLDRTWWIIYVAIVGSVLTALQGPVQLSIIIPFVYLVIAGGVALMIQQWFTVFPRNPVARPIGGVLLILAVLTSVYYNGYRYFIAWPNATETKQVYHNQP